MARYTDRTTFSRKAISDYAASLRRIAAMLDGNVDLMEGMNWIFTHCATPAELGLQSKTKTSK